MVSIAMRPRCAVSTRPCVVREMRSVESRIVIPPRITTSPIDMPIMQLDERESRVAPGHGHGPEVPVVGIVSVCSAVPAGLRFWIVPLMNRRELEPLLSSTQTW